ncbi:MAG TPA: hypothetical protein DC058_17625 [Planctomycetaceae bacterium]|nr:hypothetical protein [Planctomycetaceae bacterium]HBC63019.1 hypothetical protein [Planctomycetaceae bacterium]
MSGTVRRAEIAGFRCNPLPAGRIFLDFSGFLFFVSFSGTYGGGSASGMQGHAARRGHLCVGGVGAAVAGFAFPPR